MAPKAKSVEAEEGLSQSQSSNGSDELFIKKAFAQLRAKQQEKEDKTFLRKVANELDQELADIVLDMQECLKESDELWTSSIVDYSAIEDKICHSAIELARHEDENLKLLSDLQTQLDFVQLAAERSSALERLRGPCQGGGTLLDELSASAD